MKGMDYHRFIRMLYQLLCCGKYPFKSKKIVCVGPSNSGKTSWIAPLLEVMDREKVATVTREGKFAAHMIDEETQLLFVDEWAPGKHFLLFTFPVEYQFLLFCIDMKINELSVNVWVSLLSFYCCHICIKYMIKHVFLFTVFNSIHILLF